MNAPKKIWFDIDDCSAGPVQFYDDEILYIRADLVDELVEALKGLAVHDFGANGWNDSAERYAIKARAALKKLEDSHD